MTLEAYQNAKRIASAHEKNLAKFEAYYKKKKEAKNGGNETKERGGSSKGSGGGKDRKTSPEKTRATKQQPKEQQKEPPRRRKPRPPSLNLDAAKALGNEVMKNVNAYDNKGRVVGTKKEDIPWYKKVTRKKGT